jgi:pimeloyl-ACP methyl ester carboxylesterase
LRLPGGPEIRYVFPHAPIRPVTINGGAEMRAWYDIVAIQRSAREDEAGIRESGEAVAALIRREAERGIPADRVVLAGFSQGGAIALHAGLRYPEKLAGIIALSTYLPLRAAAGEFHEANRGTRSSWRTAASTRSCRRCWARRARVPHRGRLRRAVQELRDAALRLPGGSRGHPPLDGPDAARAAAAALVRSTAGAESPRGCASGRPRGRTVTGSPRSKSLSTASVSL